MLSWADVLAGAGLWLVHGGWLTEWLQAAPRSPERWTYYYALVADSGGHFNLLIVDAIRPVQRFMRFVCFSPAAGRRLSVRRAFVGR